MENNDLRTAWEKRAAEKGTRLDSVLFQGLSDPINGYIHDFHWRVICKYLLNYIPQNARVIDIGCGYGRISSMLLKERPDIELIGIDFSYNYCALCKKNTSMDVICGDLNSLPLRSNFFDAAIAITSLMYVEDSLCEETAEKLINILKPGGKALFIDPGQEFLRLASILKPSSRKKTTGGHGFDKDAYHRLGSAGSAKLLKYGGIPVFSALIPALYLLEHIPFLFRYCIKIVRLLDDPLFHFDKYSVHRWIVLERSF